MRFSKKFLFTTVIVLIIYGIYYFTHQPITSQHTNQVLGTTTNLALFEEPMDGRTPLLTALTQAKKEVLVEVYLLSDKQIIDSLAADESRGVSVKVMLEQHPFGGGNNNKTFQALQQDHISVEWTNSNFALTHEKTITIDDATVFILNQNLTASSFSKNREYDIEDTNAQDIQEVRNIFIADWERQNISPTGIHLVVSPINARSQLESLLQNAQKSIDIEIEDIDDTQIVGLLSQKAKTIPVRIITPTFSQVASNKKSLDILQRAGVQVKMISSPYIHAKLIIADAGKAYVGSVNLSTQSMDENREVGILVSQIDIVQKLSQDFSADWDTLGSSM